MQRKTLCCLTLLWLGACGGEDVTPSDTDTDTDPSRATQSSSATQPSGTTPSSSTSASTSGPTSSSTAGPSSTSDETDSTSIAEESSSGSSVGESSGTESGDTGTTSVDPTALLPIGSTFLGGSQFERIQGVAVGTDGSIYVGGTTHSADFPATAGAYDETKSGPSGAGLNRSDGFVAKLSPDGSDVEWATFIGGSLRESVYAVRVDSAGNVYALGSTGSSDFPTTNGAYDSTFNGPAGQNNLLADSFVVSLSPDGSTLRFGTFVAGAAGVEENPRGSIAIDEGRGRVYVSGLTSATNFPTTSGAFQENYGGGAHDGFVFALSLDGSSLEASTFLGGNGDDMAYTRVTIHPDGSIYASGATSSTNFPVSAGAFQTQLASGNPSNAWHQQGDAFVTRLTGDLDDIVFSTYIGGNDSDATGHNQGAHIDSMGRAVIAGSTSSTDFPVTAGAWSSSLSGAPDGFVVVLAEDGSAIDYATYIGGSDGESTSTMAVGPDDRVYVTGVTQSDDYPTTADAMQNSFGNGAAGGGLSDAFLAVLDPTLSTLEYGTYVGGSGTDAGAERGRSVWVTPDGTVYLAGVTDSTDFPIMAPSAQAGFGGVTDGFLVRFARR